MFDILNSLKGKRTYLTGALAVLAVAAFSLGHLNQHDLIVIMGILFPAQIAALRAAQGGQTEGGNK